MIIKRNVPLSQLTTFQNEGKVPDVYIFDDEIELAQFVDQNEHYFVLGKGSNTVIKPDPEFPPIIQISQNYHLPEIQQSTISVGAGVTVSQFMSFCKKNGIGGFEFMAGVPASIGGAVVMNFGCWGSEISDFVLDVDVMQEDGTIKRMVVSEMQYSYRNSIFHHQSLILLCVRLAYKKSTPQKVSEMINMAVKRRLESQPLRDRTFGSTFKNPPGLYAGKLLDEYGFKGERMGNVMFSEKHANFMVNLGGATFENVVEYMEKVEKTIKNKRGVSLVPEVMLVTS